MIPALLDTAVGNAGRDIIWVDRNGTATDVVSDAAMEDKVQQVATCVNALVDVAVVVTSCEVMTSAVCDR